jgi:hypothetical protein
MKAYIIKGGIGKHFLFSSFLDELTQKEQCVIYSGFPEIFEKHPGVFISAKLGQPHLYDCLEKHITEYIAYEPYWGKMPTKKVHLMESWAEGLGLSKNTNRTPFLSTNIKIKEGVDYLREQLNDFIIVQLKGGPKENNFSLVKDYPYEKELLELIVDTFPDLKIIFFGYNTPEISHQNIVKIEDHFLFFAELLKYANSFISIDSCLAHFSAAHKKEGIVLWGATGPEHFGHKHNINLTNYCPKGNLHCLRPYLRPIGDCSAQGQSWQCDEPECIKINPEVIIENLKIILEQPNE